MKKIFLTLISIAVLLAAIVTTAFVTKSIVENDKSDKKVVASSSSNSNKKGDNTDDLDFLPLGSIVTLKNGDGTELLIVGRMTLTENEGETGYFEYSAVVYPNGMEDSDQILFFNREDIEEVVYTGYVDDKERDLQDQIKKQIDDGIDYPKLGVND